MTPRLRLTSRYLGVYRGQMNVEEDTLARHSGEFCHPFSNFLCANKAMPPQREEAIA